MDDITRQFGGGATVSDQYREGDYVSGAAKLQSVIGGQVASGRSRSASDVPPLQSIRERIENGNKHLFDIIEGLERAADRISGPVPEADGTSSTCAPVYGHFIGDTGQALDFTSDLLVRLRRVASRIDNVA